MQHWGQITFVPTPVEPHRVNVITQIKLSPKFSVLTHVHSLVFHPLSKEREQPILLLNSCVRKLAKTQVPKFVFCYLAWLRLLSECTFILADWICLAAITDWNLALKDCYHELRQFSVVEIHLINQVWYSFGSTDEPTQLAAVGTQKAAEFVPKSAIVW